MLSKNEKLNTDPIENYIYNLKKKSDSNKKKKILCLSNKGSRGRKLINLMTIPP